ncbi:MAG: 3-phosphoglycerate dehydrogenase [Myxococcales bacterium]|nr:3-phosphoglycerate dehydrogenase [Myxococcales bacterium]
MMEPFSKALIVEAPHPKLDDYLREIGISPTREDDIPDEQALIDALHKTQSQILFKRSRVPVTRAVIEACPELHAIQLCSIGDDSIDKVAAAEHGVLVFNDPISNGRSVVELAVAHLIALSRRLFETDREIHEHVWSKNARGRYEIYGKRIGIIGLGNIGRQVARALEALGMEISFFDNRPVAQEIGQEMGWTMAPTLEDLFMHADMVTIHVSAYDYLGHDNTNFLDPYLGLLAEKCDKTSPRIFLNLARGNIHSSEALLDAVKNKVIRYAAVDVFPEEPAPGIEAWKNPYGDEPRVICTPHIGGATMEAQPRIARHVSQTIEGFSRYGSIRDCVYAPRFSLSIADQVRGKAVLAVVHSTARGTKKAIDDAIYEAEVDNLGSSHRDFDIGVAYDLSYLNRPLRREELMSLVERAEQLSKTPHAIRAVRQIEVPKQGW